MAYVTNWNKGHSRRPSANPEARMTTAPAGDCLILIFTRLDGTELRVTLEPGDMAQLSRAVR